MSPILMRALAAALLSAAAGVASDVALTGAQAGPVFQDVWLHEVGKPGLAR